MRRMLLAWIVLVGLVGLSEAAYLQDNVKIASNRIIVKLYPDVGSLDPVQSGPDVVVFDRALTELNKKWGIGKVERLFQSKSPKEAPETDLPGYWRFWLNRDVTYAQLESILADYSKAPLVEHVEPVGIHRINYTPTDPGWSTQQWYLQATSGDHDIDAVEGWDIERGDTTAILGITDTGVLYSHSDLQSHIWHNWQEVNGTSGVDNDGNGFVDDSVGWDFVTGTSGCWSGEDCSTTDNDPKDFNGHGTHVSGIAAAVTSNGSGVAGIAGGGGTYRGARILPLRIGWSASYFGQEVGYVGMDFAAQAIDYGRVKGVCAFNCSWGSSADGGLPAAVTSAVSAGIVFCVAAGNDNTSSQSANYLSTRNDCIDVAATTSGDIKASFSNYGTWIDVSAPGDNIYSTYSNHYTATYSSLDGTSMAAPCVTGEVGLLKAHNSWWNRTQIIPVITGNVDNINALNPSYSGQLGSGRINLNLALQASATIIVAVPNGGETWYTGESKNITWQSSSVSGNVKIELNRSYPGGAWETIVASTANDGTHTWTVTSPLTTTARIRVSSVTQPSVLDVSDAEFTIAAPFISVAVPNAGESWYLGQTQNLTWTGAGFSGNVKIELNRSYPSATWETLFASTANDLIEAWTISGATSGTCRIRISSVSVPSIMDSSNVNFSISTPFVAVTAPNGGEFWTLGIDQAITWTAVGFTDNVKIELNRTYSGGAWETLIASTPNTGTWSWTPSGAATSQARVRVSSTLVPAYSDVSNGNFTILGTPPTLTHDPLHDTATGSGTVTAFASSTTSSVASVTFYYRLTGGGSFSSLAMPATGNAFEYAASLSSLAAGTYEYYVQAVDAVGMLSALPSNAPTTLYTFRVGAVCASELAYDDGSAEWFNYPGADSSSFQWAVKFGPVQPPYVICGARFAASRSLPDAAHSPVHVWVYAADGVGGLPGTLLQDLVTGSVGNVIGGLPTGTNWAQVILRDDLGAPLTVNTAEFYVAVSEVATGLFEAFGRDTNGALNHRSYLYDPCQMAWISEDDTSSTANAGNRLIRAQGYSLAPPVATILRSGNNVNLNWNKTGAPSYAVYKSAASSGPFTLVQSTPDTFYTVVGVDTSVVTRQFYQIRSVAP